MKIRITQMRFSRHLIFFLVSASSVKVSLLVSALRFTSRLCVLPCKTVFFLLSVIINEKAINA